MDTLVSVQRCFYNKAPVESMEKLLFRTMEIYSVSMWLASQSHSAR